MHRPGSNCISNVQEINRNSTKFSLLTWTWSRFKSSWLEPYIKEYCYHYSLQGYWGDDVTIYQLVITMSFHFSLLSLIACYITIVTPESTIQSYQYITTVTLFTRTQSSTLGPRWLEYNNVFFIPMFTVALLLSVLVYRLSQFCI